MDLEDLHPLRNIVKSYHILPCLKRCQVRKREENFAFNLRVAILGQMKVKIPKSHREVQEDPFLLLGFGVNNYFDIMKSLMWMFSMISIFMLPLMFKYAHNDQKGLQTDPLYAINQFSLGNLGGSQTQCTVKPLMVDTVNLHCDVGRLDIKNVIFGVMSTEVKDPFFCREEAIWGTNPG